MKKFFAFVAAALVAFSFTSCEKGGNDPEKAGFKIEVSDITALSAKVTVTPSDTTFTYYWGVAETAQLAELKDDAELYASAKEFIEYYIEMYAMYGYTLTFEDFLYHGEDSYVFEELNPNTDYTVYAFKMDAEGNVPAGATVAKKEFKTPELKAESVKEIVLENAICDDACDVAGWWQLMAAPADSSYYVTISPVEANQLAGTWTIDDMDADYTYYADAAGYADFVSCNLVTKVENNLFILTGTALGNNSVEYHFNISATIKVLTADDFQAPAAAPKKVAAKKVPAFNKHIMLKK